VRSLKLHGGADKKNLGVEDCDALRRGLPNLEKHIENVKHFGVPGVVALNRRSSDTDAELRVITEFVESLGVPVALTEVWEKGGAGGEALGTELLSLLDKKQAEFRPLYPTNLPIKEKIDIIVRQIYGGDGADYSPTADRAIEYLQSIGLGETPVCMAKTQYSLTDDPTKLGKPSGFRITVNEVYGSAGAGFVVCKTGDIMTMPGLPKVPAAEGMSVRPDGQIVGLS
jgi:formate--tetrahydrofolate ligase